MGVQEYEEGFLLSEVPLGQGFLDLKGIVASLQKANPKIQFNLEMITRDPLKIPCLTERYWATMQDTPAHRLAAAMIMANAKVRHGGT
jgi:L-ribulose-5-phosphate 3-epimerase UlaE